MAGIVFGAIFKVNSEWFFKPTREIRKFLVHRLVPFNSRIQLLEGAWLPETFDQLHQIYSTSKSNFRASWLTMPRFTGIIDDKAPLAGAFLIFLWISLEDCYLCFKMQFQSSKQVSNPMLPISQVYSFTIGWGDFNVIKFALGNISMLFDVVFMLQHYVFYYNKIPDDSQVIFTFFQLLLHCLWMIEIVRWWICDYERQLPTTSEADSNTWYCYK